MLADTVLKILSVGQPPPSPPLSYTFWSDQVTSVGFFILEGVMGGISP